jgi:hypothetical protein
VRGSRTGLLDAFLKLGDPSPETLRSLRTRETRKGVPKPESAVLSGVLHPDAVPRSLAETLPESVTMVTFDDALPLFR